MIQIDKSKFHPDDKDWMKSRKEEWRHVQKNLKHISRSAFRGRPYLKEHKQLFFFGEMSDELLIKSGGGAFGFMLPFFLMWYEPEITQERMDDIVKSCESASVLEESRNALFGFNTGGLTGEYGYLGGREEMMTKALHPSTSYEDVWMMPDGEEFHLCQKPYFIIKHCIAIRGVVALGKLNPNHPSIFLFDHLSECFSKVLHEETKLKNFGKTLLSISTLDSDRGVLGVSEKASAYARELRQRYLKRDFSEALLLFWDKLLEEEGIAAESMAH